MDPAEGKKKGELTAVTAEDQEGEKRKQK